MKRAITYSRRSVIGFAAATAASIIIPGMANAKTVRITDKSLRDGELILDLTGNDVYHVEVSKGVMSQILLSTKKGTLTVAEYKETGQSFYRGRIKYISLFR